MASYTANYLWGIRLRRRSNNKRKGIHKYKENIRSQILNYKFVIKLCWLCSDPIKTASWKRWNLSKRMYWSHKSYHLVLPCKVPNKPRRSLSRIKQETWCVILADLLLAPLEYNLCDLWWLQKWSTDHGYWIVVYHFNELR